MICRYADDWVCAFQYENDAKRFFKVLPKRLGRFGLEAEPSKTQILRFSRYKPGMERGKTFTFLGFEFFWFWTRSGKVAIKRRTAPKKVNAALQRMKEWLKNARNLPKELFFRTLKQKLTGHYNYYYVRGNSRSVWSFYEKVIMLVRKWLNRRSQRKSYTWERLKKLLSYMGVPKPKAKWEWKSA